MSDPRTTAEKIDGIFAMLAERVEDDVPMPTAEVKSFAADLINAAKDASGSRADKIRFAVALSRNDGMFVSIEDEDTGQKLYLTVAKDATHARVSYFAEQGAFEDLGEVTRDGIGADGDLFDMFFNRPSLVADLAPVSPKPET